jgi:hypothetical protein
LQAMLRYRAYQLNACTYGFKVMASLKYATLYIEAIAFDAPTFLLQEKASKKKYGSLSRCGS